MFAYAMPSTVAPRTPNATLATSPAAERDENSASAAARSVPGGTSSTKGSAPWQWEQLAATMSAPVRPWSAGSSTQLTPPHVFIALQVCSVSTKSYLLNDTPLQELLPEHTACICTRPPRCRHSSENRSNVMLGSSRVETTCGPL